MKDIIHINRLKNNFLPSIVFFLWAFFCSVPFLSAQQFPGEDENIPFLITFGKESSTSWGDDDFSQTFFLSVPKSQIKPLYIRVFDPDIGGLHDENKGEFNSKAKFSVFGGKLAYSHPDAQGSNPEGEYNSGTLLASKYFGNEAKYDNKWYTFGPFNPSEGEYIENMGAYVFKIVTDGVSGDDGNIYKYYLSTNPGKNIKIEGANAFTYEYTFRLPNNRSICHIYPYINQDVISVQQYNFDWDGDGLIRIVSSARNGELVKMSTDNDWAISKHKVVEEEKNSSLDIQLIKSKEVKNNNVVFRITNQYGEYLPFYSIPIGGKPVYQPKLKIRKIE